MQFLVDAQLPPALARWIADYGYPAVHVSDVGLLSASDTEIWNFAAQNSYIVVTKDEDFAIRVTRDPILQVVWLRRGNCRTKVLIAWIEPLFQLAVTALESGEHLLEMT